MKRGPEHFLFSLEKGGGGYCTRVVVPSSLFRITAPLVASHFLRHAIVAAGVVVHLLQHSIYLRFAFHFVTTYDTDNSIFLQRPS